MQAQTLIIVGLDDYAIYNPNSVIKAHMNGPMFRYIYIYVL